jgi:hypothetical protein
VWVKGVLPDPRGIEPPHCHTLNNSPRREPLDIKAKPSAITKSPNHDRTGNYLKHAETDGSTICFTKGQSVAVEKFNVLFDLVAANIRLFT